MKRTILLYGVGLAVLALLLSSIRYFYFIHMIPIELMILLLALMFTALGVWAGRRLVARPAADSSVEGVNKRAIDYLGLTSRELDVLRLMAEGCSNREISERLFISVNTVKSHVSSLLGKLDARRRTQAVRKAQSLGLIHSSKSVI